MAQVLKKRLNIGDRELLVCTAQFQDSKVAEKVRVRDSKARRFLPLALIRWADGGESISMESEASFVRTFTINDRYAGAVNKASISCSVDDLQAFLQATQQA